MKSGIEDVGLKDLRRSDNHRCPAQPVRVQGDHCGSRSPCRAAASWQQTRGPRGTRPFGHSRRVDLRVIIANTRYARSTSWT